MSELYPETTSISSDQEGASAALGNITESTPAPSPAITESARRRLRRKRHAMRDTAASLLGKHRVSSCQKVPSYGVQNSGKSMGVSKNSNGQAHFHGVGSCGDVWACPVCAQKVAAGRREEVLHAMRQHREAGGVCILVTFTFAHTRADELSVLVPGFCKALSRLKASRAYKRVRDLLGHSGSIRALEVTHGGNGWHPHCHEIWFLDDPATFRDLQKAKDDLYVTWAKVCMNSGLGRPTKSRGIDIQYFDQEGHEAVGSYVAKWGHEMTSTHTKTGKNGSRTPWDILADLDESYSYRDATLFREYVSAFKGRAQLYWSPGLKERFQVVEFSDQERAELPESEHVADLSNEQWKAIKSLNAQTLVLSMAERVAVPEFLEFLDRLVDRYERKLIERRTNLFELKRRVETTTLRAMRRMNLDFPQQVSR